MRTPTLDDGTQITLDDVGDRVNEAKLRLTAIATTGEAHMDEMLAEAEQKLRAIRQRIKRLQQVER